MRISSMILALALAIPFASDALAAPTLANDRKIDIELREVEVQEVFKLLAGISETNVTVDPCVHGKVDIRLKNTPASLVFDALANKLGLVYSETSKGVEVTCRASASPTAPEATRVSLVEHATPMPEGRRPSRQRGPPRGRGLPRDPSPGRERHPGARQSRNRAHRAGGDVRIVGPGGEGEGGGGGLRRAEDLTGPVPTSRTCCDPS